MSPKVRRIVGVITTEDGHESEFSIDTEGSYLQWGSSTSILADSRPVLDTITNALIRDDLVLAPEDVDIDESITERALQIARSMPGEFPSGYASFLAAQEAAA